MISKSIKFQLKTIFIINFPQISALFKVFDLKQFVQNIILDENNVDQTSKRRERNY